MVKKINGRNGFKGMDPVPCVLNECYKDLSKQRIKGKQLLSYFILNFLFVNLETNIPV
jgi:hypothetical protein